MPEKSRKQARNEDLATELIQYLLDSDLNTDVYIFWNGKRWDGTKRFVEDGHSPLEQFEYGNPETLSMTFDGPLCSSLYYGEYGWGVHEKVTEICNKHGYYWEFGHHWNMSCYDTN